ncbi:monocyte to macrophage differentiation factor isoform X1 [Hydra vulgaris]|uniref:Monocyte to macrophage differentiation protein n=1 Tax=Hydra vulgaris TaxID=6087 RepID=T2MDC0_HYDVU|nr:monocyte to macrophage differentiation factor isoform X1 [Hydra vulgaris]
MDKKESYQQYWLKNKYMNYCPKKGERYMPTLLEQLANCFTHGVGIIPAIIAVWKMLERSLTNEQLFCTILYGTAFISLFIVSTTFHVLSLAHRSTVCCHIFHLGDRFIIYIYIAATYTPWFLLQCNEEYGASSSNLVWLFAFIGVSYTMFYHEKYKMFETIMYLFHGFFPAALLAKLSTKGFFELAFGGLLYVIGVFFFKSDGKIPFAHAVWHIFSLTAAWIHHFAIWTHLY